MMKPQNELALIVAYFLSRFDKEGYSLLGFSNFTDAFSRIGNCLGVKPNTVKNMRDEFDPYHQNSRTGWKRELRGSRKKILTAFQQTDDETLLEIVKEIVFNKKIYETDAFEDLHALFGDERNTRKSSNPVFILRGPTGTAAELFFVDYFKMNMFPLKGTLSDCRELGCGYDYTIENDGKI